MILRRFIKSWKGIAILLLTLFSAFCVSLVFTSMQTQWITVQENEKLKVDQARVDEWKKCFSTIETWRVDSQEFIKVDDVRNCGY